MILDNGILRLELTNMGGEMASLIYKGMDVLYKGDGPYWSGKNPSLFPMISSPNAKQYTYNGKTYTCRNHGLIRYMNLETIVDDGEKVSMRLVSNDETRKEYPFDFEYVITYRLDNNRVLINYDITNKSNEVMPFTFGIHPGFIVRDFNTMSLYFIDDEDGDLISVDNRDLGKIKLGNYTNYHNDLNKLQTIVLKNLKSKQVVLKTNEYDVTVDMSKFKYLGLWSQNDKADYLCIEPWLSNNFIEDAINPFDPKFELEYLKPNETFNIDYYIEVK